ncbi:MAG TPA: twin-arginine translocase TatA/TatE family subunit [Tissierellia bacterium]|jgi:sec-independent protein translocase protein TatA|nr:twin-arginine translocase TatA/TatE family subunit [Tissierellia bacterium]
MFGKLGTQELLVIFAIVLVVFGPKQLPKLGKTFGKTIKSFKDGIEESNIEDSDIEDI